MDGSIVGPLSAAPPVMPPLSAQPQFSQLTPVYEPGPTNTIADIPQPLVKGIEFVRTPTSMPPAPVTLPNPEPIPIAAEPIASPLPMPPSSQLIQPVIAPVPSTPIAASPVEAFVEPTPAVDGQLAASVAATQSANDHKLQEIENTVVNQSTVATPVNTIDSYVTEPFAQTAAVDPGLSNYFNSTAPQADIIINKQPVRKSGLSGINKKPILIVSAIVLAIVILSVGGYLIYNNIISPPKTQDVPVTASPTPAAKQPGFTETSTSTAATSDTTTGSTTASSPAVTTMPDTTTQSSAAATTPTTPDSTPVIPAATPSGEVTSVPSTGLQW